MKFRVRKLSPDERDVALAGHTLTEKQMEDFDRQLARVVWVGMSECNKNDVLAGPPKKKPPSPAVQNAVEWLRERLATGPERLKALREEADNLPEPINANSLYAARDLLKLSVTKVSGQTIWELPRCEGEVQNEQ